MKVYIVTAGSYSDYHIEGVYSSMENAEYALKLHGADSVEEYELDDYSGVSYGMFLYQVIMNYDGVTQSAKLSNPSVWGDGEWSPTIQKDNCAVFHVMAYDQTHAIKIANERRTMLIANDQWTTSWEVFRRNREAINKGKS